MSTDRESELSLAADAPAAAEFLTGRGGTLHDTTAQESGTWWAELHPASQPQETFCARIAWSVYPGAAPSVKFSTEIGGGLADPVAWPVIPGYRPGSLDICKPFTAEGFTLHPDWAASSQAWVPDGNPFLAVVRELQRDLNSDGYQGRWRG
ncbi:MAG: hypothetical protein ACHQ17_07935 [Polyangia bacterium]